MGLMEKYIVHSQRLQIRAKGAAELLAVLEEESDPAVRGSYRKMIQRLRQNPGAEKWLVFRDIVRHDGTQVGLFSFAGPPEDGAVELGYGIFLPFEGQGYATEAVAAMTAWCLEQPEVRCVVAEAEASNAASCRVLEKCGFVPAWERDGVRRYERR